MRNRSNLVHEFSRVPVVSHPRSVFPRSCDHKTAFDADYLVPIFVDEILPGDTMNLHMSMLVRLNSATIKPVMDNLFVDTFWFFVPNRLLWTNWVKMMGEQTNPADSISYTVPQITGPNVASGGIPIGHLFDYMGLPVGPLSGGGATTGITFDNLHGRAYNQIWNNWFRSEDLQNSVTVDVGDGPDTFTNYNLLKRGKRHDYFTSCLPWTQKGGTAVPLPLGTSATVTTQLTPILSGAQNPILFRQSAAGADTGLFMATFQADNTMIQSTTVPGGTGGSAVYPSNLYADLTNATASTVNALRQAITTQQFLENDARGGTRYPELIQAHFGVTNPDARVQRPELLATYSSRLSISPVAQTSASAAPPTSVNQQAGLSGFGTASFVGHGFTKSFTEHGVLLGLVAVRADITYQQGMNKMWSRRTRYDFYWPEFANLGEQAVLNREIYANLADGTGAAAKDGVFGYIPRYDEYRYKPSLITGNMRSYNGNGVNANTLDVWHLSEAFSAQPSLGATFIQSSTPLDRAVAVPSQEHFIMDALFSIKHARCMPVYAVPGLLRL